MVLASRTVPPAPAPERTPAGAGTGHFRAHERRPVRLLVEILVQRTGILRQATVVDLSLAGAGLETDEPFLAGDRLTITMATPTMWDPLVIEGVTTWAHPPRASLDLDSFGRSRAVARAGVVFDYPTPAVVLAMFAMLATLDYE